MEFTKRQMLLLPEVNPTSFVFFFERGKSGASWSIRDYSIGNHVRVYRPGDFPWTADEIFQKAKHAFNAPTHHTEDLAFWHKHTIELNNKCGVNTAGSSLTTSGTQFARSSSTLQTAATPSKSSFPILNLGQLLDQPKGRKSPDMERILHSPNSEDWVTWNFFQVLLQQCPSEWWAHFVGAARQRNLELNFPFDDHSCPAVRLWNSVPSPRQYEEESRRRMQASRNPMWIARSTASERVEGSSEIDIALDHDKFLVFIEAKLGSDVSMNTTYDPHRNQIARNIDCLIDQAGERQPVFWLLVRDEEPSRAYVQLMNGYKSDPSLLALDLPHRDVETLTTSHRTSRLCCGATSRSWSAVLDPTRKRTP
jgi:hypothetical protein